MAPAFIESPPEPWRQALGRLGATGWFALASLAGMGAALCFKLAPDWIGDPNLSHGWAAPAASALLLVESRRAGPWRWLPAGRATVFLVAAAVAGALAGLAASGLFAVAAGWSHALVDFTSAAAFSCAAVAALAAFAEERIRLIPFNWSSFVAATLWPLCAPLPPGTSTRLTVGLQLAVTEGVVRALHLLGIAARRDGNLLELANGAVGVEDACSGVRSLVACIFAALLFSATIVRRPRARVLLVAASVPLALAMNFARSLFLTLLVHRGLDIAGAWHDATGYAVLGVTALALGVLAWFLGRGQRRGPALSAAAEGGEGPPFSAESGLAADGDSSFDFGSRSSPRPLSPGSSVAPESTPGCGRAALAGSPPPALPLLAAGLAGCLALIAFFVAVTRPTDRKLAAPPDLLATLPGSAPGWSVATSTDLRQFSSTLRTEALAQRTYVRRDAEGVKEFAVYLAYWRPGQAPVSLVASHTPDACWPGAGWTPRPVAISRERLALGSRTLAAAEHRLFFNDGIPQQVWFWHLYAGRPISYVEPRSPRALLELAWHYGFQRGGDQLFVRVSSNRPWSDLAGEPLVAELFRRLADFAPLLEPPVHTEVQAVPHRI